MNILDLFGSRPTKEDTARERRKQLQFSKQSTAADDILLRNVVKPKPLARVDAPDRLPDRPEQARIPVDSPMAPRKAALPGKAVRIRSAHYRYDKDEMTRTKRKLDTPRAL